VRDSYHTVRHAGKVVLSVLLHYVRLIWIRWVIVRRARRTHLIAIALIEHLGDIVACEPIARRVREEHPDGYILWLVRTQYRELIQNNPCIDAVFTVHCLTEKEILIHSGLLNLAIDLHFPERHCALCPESWVRRAGAHTPGSVGLSNFYAFGSILRSVSLFAGVKPSDELPRVYIGENAKKTVDALRLPPLFAVFHCTSNTAEKDWPRDQWEKLARHVTAEHGCEIVEVGLQPTLNDSGLASYVNATGTLSILETAEVIRRGKIFIGVDSGPAHLANAVGTYGIVLLGSYLGFKKYNPFSGNYGDGSNAALLHVEGGVASIPLERVRQAVDNAFQSQRSMNGW
jgi:ADP-heptose:LPS heptosyltransferase